MPRGKCKVGLLIKFLSFLSDFDLKLECGGKKFVSHPVRVEWLPADKQMDRRDKADSHISILLCKLYSRYVILLNIVTNACALKETDALRKLAGSSYGVYTGHCTG